MKTFLVTIVDHNQPFELIEKHKKIVANSIGDAERLVNNLLETGWGILNIQAIQEKEEKVLKKLGII